MEVLRDWARSRAAQAAQPVYDGQYIDSSAAYRGDLGGSEVLGQLSRAQWDDWVKRFSPYIDKLAGIATDEQLPEENAQRALGVVGQSFDNARMGLDLQESRLGTSLTPDQAQARSRSFALAEAGAKVDAANSTRSATRDRQQRILAGGAALDQLPQDPSQA